MHRWNGNVGEVRPGELEVPLSLTIPQKAEPTAFLRRNEPALMTRDPLYCVAEGMRSGSLHEGTERGHSACEGSETAAVRFYDT